MSHFTQDCQHEETANKSKGRHEIKIITKTLIKQIAKEVSPEASAEILKGVNKTQGETGHFSAAQIHRSCHTKNRVSGIGRERNQDQEQDGGIGCMKLSCQEDNRCFK